MQHKCQLSLFLFRGYQPAFTEEYLFLLKKVPPQRFELEGLFHLRFQKSAWFGWQGPGPARRSLWPWSQAGLGRARPAPSPRSGTLHPRPRRLVPPSPGCGTGPGPHGAGPSPGARWARGIGTERAGSRSAILWRHLAASLAACSHRPLFRSAEGAESGLCSFKRDVPSAAGMGSGLLCVLWAAHPP